mmetsp:Transcript_33394/g.38348  ORF Transcript_33394/g.38348 Transcript_33394/m.38348 type:complete len:136 (+) Transcript_33394:374-781(+)
MQDALDLKQKVVLSEMYDEYLHRKDQMDLSFALNGESFEQRLSIEKIEKMLVKAKEDLAAVLTAKHENNLKAAIEARESQLNRDFSLITNKLKSEIEGLNKEKADLQGQIQNVESTFGDTKKTLDDQIQTLTKNL